MLRLSFLGPDKNSCLRALSGRSFYSVPESMLTVSGGTDMRIQSFNPSHIHYQIYLFKTVEEYRAECFIVHASPKVTANMQGLRQEWFLGDDSALARHSKPHRHPILSLTAPSASIAFGDCAKVGT